MKNGEKRVRRKVVTNCHKKIQNWRIQQTFSINVWPQKELKEKEKEEEKHKNMHLAFVSYQQKPAYPLLYICHFLFDVSG